MHMHAVIAITQSHYAVESWELKAKLASPNMLDCHWGIEVISVNWEDQDTATHASQVIVAYRWHGIMYVIEFHNNLIFSSFTFCLGQLLGYNKDDGSLVVAHGGMVIEKHFGRFFTL
jgi:hypothetical protein